MKFLILFFLGMYLFFHVAAYFINKKDYAKVYLNDCSEIPMKTCTTHEGKIKRTFFKQDYIVTENGKDIYLKYDDVHATSWTETKRD